MALINVVLALSKTGDVVMKEVVGGLKGIAKESGLTRKALDNVFQGIGQGFGQQLYATLAQVPGMLSNAAFGFISFADGLSEMNDQTDLGTTRLQELAYAAALNGSSLEGVVGAVGKLQKGLSEGNEIFSRLGLDAEKLKSMGTDQAVTEVATAIANLKDPADRTAAAMAAFGKSGAELLPTLKNLSSASEDFRARGLGIDEDAVAAGAALQDQLDTLQATYEALLNQVGAVIAENDPLRAGLEALTDVVGMLAVYVRDNREELSAWVTTGLVFMTQALVESVGVIEHVVAGFKALADIWAAVKAAGEVLFATMKLQWDLLASMGSLDAAKKAWAEYKDTVSGAAAGLKADLERNQSVMEGVVGVTGKVRDAFGVMVTAVTSSADGHTKAAKAATDHAGGLGKLGPEAKAAAAALKEEEQYLKATAKALEEWNKGVAKSNAARLDFSLLGRSASEASTEMGRIADQVERFGGVSELSDSQLEHVIESLTKLREEGGENASGIEAQTAALEEFAARGGDAASLITAKWDAANEELERQTNAYLQLLAQMPGLEGAAARAILARGEAGKDAGEKTKTGTEQAIEALGKLTQIFDELGSVMAILGVRSDSMAARVVAGLGDITAAAQDGVRSFAAFSSGDILGGIVHGLKAVGGLVSGLKKIFGGKSEAEKVMEDVGRRWGVAITKGLAEQIAKDAKRLGSTALGELANLGKVIEEAGGVGAFGLGKTITAMDQLTAAVAAGQISAKEAGAVFDDIFGDAAAEAISQTTGIAEQGFVRMAMAARAAGVESEALTRYFADQAKAGVDSLSSYVQNATVQTQAGATALAASAGVLYDQLLAAGLTPQQALAQLGPTIQTLRQQFEDAGFSGGAAFDALAARAALAADEVAGPLFKGVSDLTGLMVSLHNQGGLTQDIFAGLTAEIGATYQKLVDEGKAGPEALALMAPDLQKIWELQQAYGYEVDATTQALIDQAVTAGMVGDEHRSAADRMAEGMERVVTAIEAIAIKMGALPAAAQASASGINSAFGSVHGPTFGSPTTGTGPAYHQNGAGYASGFESAMMPWGPGPGGTTYLPVHPRERVSVTPATQNPEIYGSAARAGGGGGVSVAAPVVMPGAIVVQAGPGTDPERLAQGLTAALAGNLAQGLEDQLVRKLGHRMRTGQ